MTFLEILNNIGETEIEDGGKASLIDFIKRFKENVNYGVKYKFLEKTDSVLNYFKDENEQLKIINEKFKKLRTNGDLFDLLSEILVCYEYLDKNPEFIKEENKERKKKTSDIKTDLGLIEIKRIRHSDYQEEIFKEILDNKEEENLLFVKKKIEQDLTNTENSLLKKVEQKIDKAIRQIGKNKGIIYLIFSLDLHTKSTNSLEQRKEKLFNSAESYFKNKRLKNKRLKIIELTSLIK